MARKFWDEVLGVLTVFCILFEILIVYMSYGNTVPMKKIYTEKYLITKSFREEKNPHVPSAYWCQSLCPYCNPW